MGRIPSEWENISQGTWHWQPGENTSLSIKPWAFVQFSVGNPANWRGTGEKKQRMKNEVKTFPEEWDPLNWANPIPRRMRAGICG